jgi:hypothetical protein
LKVLSSKVKGKIIINLDGSGKWENIKYGIELNNELRLNEELIP